MMSNDHYFPKPLHSPLGSIDEEGNTVLDEHILDDVSTDMAGAGFGQRHDSFATNGNTLSRGENQWPTLHPDAGIAPFHPINLHGNPFPQPAGSQPHQPQSPQYANYGENAASWQQRTKSGSSLHDAYYQPYEAQFEVKPKEHFDNDTARSQQPLPQTQGQRGPDAYARCVPATASPQSENGWLSASSSDHREQIPKREPISRFVFDNPPHLRRDGVRKKNARFDIPEERTVNTIDSFIRQCDPNDETALKELKQQKRLLRNRQAALDSRSRKKEHTQKLEEQTKYYGRIIDGLEQEVAARRLQEETWSHERAQWQHYVDRLNWEKEEIVRLHTLETADLRKKNAYLTEEAHMRADIPMSTLPSSVAFPSNFSDFDRLAMDDSPSWDGFSSFLDQSTMDAEMPKQATSLPVRAKENKPTAKEDDKSVASGLLVMLLLCGAWVASNSNAAPGPIRKMPEEVRAASAMVLDTIYKDAGVQPRQAPPVTDNAATKGPGQPQTTPLNFSTPLDSFSLHQQLTTPSHQQQRNQIFSLSTDQYNHMTSDDFFDDQPETVSPPTRKSKLADALAALRPGKQGTATDAYTKSLLWDEIPTNVVRDFARMVSENSYGIGRYESNEPMS